MAEKTPFAIRIRGNNRIWMGSSWVGVWVIPKTLKMVPTVLVIISLSMGNALVIKKEQLISYTMDLQTKVV